MIVAQRKYLYDEVKEQNIEVKKNTVVKKKGIKATVKIKIICAILCFCCIGISILLGYSQLAEMKYRINLLQKDIAEMEAVIENLKVEVESVQRLNIVEEKAKLEIGMQYPNKDQIEYIEVGDLEIGMLHGIDEPLEMDFLEGVKDKIIKFISF